MCRAESCPPPIRPPFVPEIGAPQKYLQNHGPPPMDHRSPTNDHRSLKCSKKVSKRLKKLAKINDMLKLQKRSFSEGFSVGTGTCRHHRSSPYQFRFHQLHLKNRFQKSMVCNFQKPSFFKSFSVGTCTCRDHRSSPNQFRFQQLRLKNRFQILRFWN